MRGSLDKSLAKESLRPQLVCSHYCYQSFYKFTSNHNICAMGSLVDKKSPSIPVIDFLSWTSPFNVSPEDRLETARELVEACHTTGFVYITNHGISPELLGEAFAMSKKFFGLPTDKKMTAGNAGSQSFRGYSWPGLENTSAVSDEGTKVPGTEKEIVDFNVRNQIQDRVNMFPNGMTGMLRPRLRLQYSRYQCLASPRRPPQLPVLQHKVLLGVLAHLTACPQSRSSWSRSPG